MSSKTKKSSTKKVSKLGASKLSIVLELRLDQSSALYSLDFAGKKTLGGPVPINNGI